MFRNLISPVQAWLLAKGQCVGCGAALSQWKRQKLDDGNEQITCKCKRVFVYDLASKKYRRALIEEVK
jgi:hypothetical protein